MSGGVGCGLDFGFEWGFGVVDNLSFDWDVLVLFDFPFLGNIVDLFFRNVLWDVLPKILNSIIVSDSNFSRYFLNSNFFLEFRKKVKIDNKYND